MLRRPHCVEDRRKGPLDLADAVGKPSTHNDALERLENVWLGIFTIEMFMTIYANGLFSSGDRKGYLAYGWNWLDGFIVFAGLFTVMLPASASEDAINVGALRMLRVMRPLRAMSRNKGMQVLVMALVLAWVVVVVF